MNSEEFQGKTLEERRNERRDKVIAVYSKIYGLAKIVFQILTAYGIELDNAPSGIKFHIERVESEMNQMSTTQLLKTIEDMYYALYARLNIEIGNVQLCQSFHSNVRRMALSQKCLTEKHLPDPSHLNCILNACKRILKSEDVCGFLNKEIIRQHQADYVRRAVGSSAAAGYYQADPVGYRRHIQRLISDPKSPFCQKWCGLNPIYKSAPGMVLATLSEKYLAHLPKRMNYVQDPVREEWKYIFANREGTAAMLRSIAVGEYRRVEGVWTIRNARMNIICAFNQPDSRQSFADKCAELAAALFDGLCMTKRNTRVPDMVMELKVELQDGLDLFHEEVTKYRRSRMNQS